MSHNLEFWKSGMLGRLLTLDSLVRALGMRIQADSRFLEKFSKFIFFDFYGRWNGRGRGMCGRRCVGSTRRYLFRFDTSFEFLFFGFEFATFLLQFSQILFVFQFLLKHMIRNALRTNRSFVSFIRAPRTNLTYVFMFLS